MSQCEHTEMFFTCKACGQVVSDPIEESDFVMFKAPREGLNRIIQTLRKYKGYVGNDTALLEAINLLEGERDSIL